MDNFIVSARKYRPSTFESVVGQQNVTNTLVNAIKNNHLAQAFLFCGPRGVGKTTCARILAKAVNHPDQLHELDSIDDENLNIFELDAASNNSVEDIRSLIDQVRIAPSAGQQYKVYIIDEVHMLSTQAFNAFLKTLEEPPPYAIFILATTEKHKILPTILSRCQTFDFNRITVNDMATHLAYIAEKEKVSVVPEALHIIAQKADGGLRDALSMFDMLVTFTDGNLTYQNVIENLNVLDLDYYFKVSEAMLKQDISSGLLILNDVLNHGFDAHLFIIGLAEHLRNIMVCLNPSTIKLLELSDQLKQRYQEHAPQWNGNWLLSALRLTNECDIHFKTTKNQRLLVELCLMQLCSLTAEGAEKKK
ncbi:MAG: DNA polymerase-3 subunit gamma/tau [Flavobacteriales bacterium]|jgi:DNA polymerase-3 subunit gamma/tau